METLVTCPRTESYQVPEPGFEPGLSCHDALVFRAFQPKQSHHVFSKSKTSSDFPDSRLPLGVLPIGRLNWGLSKSMQKCGGSIGGHGFSCEALPFGPERRCGGSKYEPQWPCPRATQGWRQRQQHGLRSRLRPALVVTELRCLLPSWLMWAPLGWGSEARLCLQRGRIVGNAWLTRKKLKPSPKEVSQL